MYYQNAVPLLYLHFLLCRVALILVPETRAARCGFKSYRKHRSSPVTHLTRAVATHLFFNGKDTGPYSRCVFSRAERFGADIFV